MAPLYEGTSDRGRAPARPRKEHMDPDTVLAQLCNAAKDFNDAHKGDDADDDASVLADGFLALDEWLRKGGFLPQVWQPRTERPSPAPTVHVLHWVHKHGADVWVFDNHDALVKQKAGIAQTWFEQEIDDPEVLAAIGAALDNQNWEVAGTLYAEWMEARSVEFFQGFETRLQSEAT